MISCARGPIALRGGSRPPFSVQLAALAGFGVVRFLKSSADDADRSSARNLRAAPGIPGAGVNPSHDNTWGIARMNSQSSRSDLPELFSDAVVGQLAKLIGNEFELARTELSEKVSQAGRAAGMIGAGAVILIPALVLLLSRFRQH